MRKQRVVSCALTAAFVASMISIGPEKLTKTYAAELVNNGFEVNYDGWYADSDIAELVAVPGGGYGETRGMKIFGRTSPEEGACSSKGFYLDGGKEYNYSFKVYSETDETFHVTVLTKDMETEAETVKEIISQDVSGGEWTELSAKYTAPDGDYEFKITITTDSTNDFSFDDVLITEERPVGYASAQPSGKGLKDEFGAYFRVGNILNGGTVKNSTITAEFLLDYNAVECENETKPDATLVQSGSSNTNIRVSLNSCAAICEFAATHGLGFRGHTFVWHSQTPEWFFKDNFQNGGNWVSKSVMNQRMESYIANMFNAYATQYPSLILYAYDVCNECVSDDSNRTANNGGARVPGIYDGKSPWVQVYGDNSFVEQAFTYARKYAPKYCKLYYNDYNEYWDHKRNCIADMTKKLKEKGVLDGVGMQSHINANWNGFSGYDAYTNAMKMYLNNGCDVQITELDISREGGSISDADQAKKYAAIFKAAMDWNIAHPDGPSVTLVQLWGPNDANSWVAKDKNGNKNYPLIFDENHQRKTAYNSIAAVVPDSQWTSGMPYTGPGSGDYKPPVIEPDENGFYFRSDFEGNTDSWEGRFGAGVATSGRVAYEGKEALRVEERTAAYDGAKRSLNTAAFKPGEEYSFSVNVTYFDGAETTEFKFSLQYTGSDGEAHYEEIASGTGVQGQWLQLANTNFKIPADATDVSIYVETTDGTTENFYIDDACGAVAGKVIAGAGQPKVVKVLPGDINFDGMVDAFDMAAARKGIINGISDAQTKKAADVDKSGKFEIADVVLLQDYILRRINEFPVAEQAVEIEKMQQLFSGISVNSSWKYDGENNPMTTQRFGADPGWMVYDGRLYIYTTNDAFEYYQDGRLQINTYNSGTINCVSTADMVNWTDHGAIPVAGRNGRTKNGVASWASAAWAPDAAWKMINGKPKFFLYFANSGGGIGVLTADSPTGPWTDPLGHALLTHGTPNCSDVEWMFDPGVYYDENTDEAYLFFGGGRKNGIPAATPGTGRVVKLGKDMISLAGNPVKMDIPYLFEDSSVIKIGDTWYYSYCSNWDVGNQTINGVNFGSADIVYMTSKDPLSWNSSNFAGNVFKNTATQRIDNGGNNHHSIIYFKGKYYVAYHSRQQSLRMGNTFIDGSHPNDRSRDNKDGNYRSTQINECSFSNGKLSCSGNMKGCSQIEDLDPYQVVQAETMSNQSKNVSIDGLMDTTVKASKGEWTKVTGAKFSKGANKLTVKASSANGCAIKVCTDRTKSDAVAYVEIPAGGSMSEITVPTISDLSGSTDLYFVFSGDITFDSWSFS